MNLRAIIFDVYQTLLEVNPPPADAENRWRTLCLPSTGSSPTLEVFARRCQEIIRREHNAARAQGIPHPEVYWPNVAKEALPQLAGRPAAEVDDFLFAHAQLQRTVSLMPGAVEVLSAVARDGLRLGIASNSQPYTLRELDTALSAVGLERETLFDPEICFWSFRAGFSKPDPHVFRCLRLRLEAMGVAAGQTLMVGDRADNDIAPAQAQGWQTWQMTRVEGSLEESCGDWAGLGRHLRERHFP